MRLANMAPNKRKKKATHNPARGFATVSVPSSRSKDEAAEEAPFQDDILKDGTNERSPLDGGVSQEPASTSTSTDRMTALQLEQHLEDSEISIAVETYSSKVKKDVVRQVRILETDRRLLRPQALSVGRSRLFDEDSITKILGLVAHEPPSSLYSPPPSLASTLTIEIDLSLKLWTLQETLSQLGFPKDNAVMQHILDRTILGSSKVPPQTKDIVWGIEEAISWYALNVEEKDLPRLDNPHSARIQRLPGDLELSDEGENIAGKT